jgi:hypothetical protein
MSEILKWGRDWTVFVDKRHYQLKLGITLAMLRDKFEKGTSFTMLA